MAALSFSNSRFPGGASHSASLSPLPVSRFCGHIEVHSNPESATVIFDPLVRNHARWSGFLNSTGELGRSRRV